MDHAVGLLCDRGLVLRVAEAGSDEAIYAVPTVVDLAVQQVTTLDVARDLDTAAKNGWPQAIAVGIASTEHERGSRSAAPTGRSSRTCSGSATQT